MTDQTTPTPPADQQGRPARCRGRGRGFLFILFLVVAAGLTGALATKAFSSGFGPGAWRHGGFMQGRMDPGQIEDRADRAVKHLAIEIDATNEQQDKLRAVVKAAVRDLVPMRDKVAAARTKARDLLTQPTVDRAAIEALRTEQIAAADAASKRFTQAIADAAEILTAEQRRRINDFFPPRGGWGGWHRD